jgi:hypothetical protein
MYVMYILHAYQVSHKPVAYSLLNYYCIEYADPESIRPVLSDYPSIALSV